MNNHFTRHTTYTPLQLHVIAPCRRNQNAVLCRSPWSTRSFPQDAQTHRQTEQQTTRAVFARSFQAGQTLPFISARGGAAAHAMASRAARTHEREAVWRCWFERLRLRELRELQREVANTNRQLMSSETDRHAHTARAGSAGGRTVRVAVVPNTRLLHLGDGAARRAEARRQRKGSGIQGPRASHWRH